MPKLPEPGIPALYNYQSVKYYHVDAEPGISLVLSSDPWSYLHAWLAKKVDTFRGNNRRCFQRAIYYAELAEDFYKAAEVTNIPTATSTTPFNSIMMIIIEVAKTIAIAIIEHHHCYHVP